MNNLFLYILLFISVLAYPQVAINEDASDPDESAILDIKSKHMGLLVPRMNFAEMYRVENPATGLLIFNTSANAFYFFDGKEWKNILHKEDDKLQIMNIKKMIHLTPHKAPETPKEGDVYMDEDTHKLRCWNGTEWKDFW
jgi:hypothetical protein